MQKQASDCLKTLLSIPPQNYPTVTPLTYELKIRLSEKTKRFLDEIKRLKPHLSYNAIINEAIFYYYKYIVELEKKEVK